MIHEVKGSKVNILSVMFGQLLTDSHPYDHGIFG